jgi:nucleoside-diphosphate-sugar epimerase
VSRPNILITGGAGYIGSVLVQKLMESKKVWSLASFRDINPEGSTKGPENPGFFSWTKVTVYDNLMYKQTPLTNYCYKDDFEFVRGDVRDHDKLLPLIKEADIIIPLAAIVGFPACERDKVLAEQVNYEHVKFIAENMTPDTTLVYPNTNSGYGIGEGDTFCTEETPLNPISHYGITKCKAEKEVLKVGGVSLRLATVFGVSPRMRLDLLVNDFTYKAHHDGYIVLFEKDFKRNYIHVQDVALTFIRAMIDYRKMSGEAYNVGRSDSNLSKLQLAEKIKEQIPKFSIQWDEIASDPDKRDYIVSNEKLESLTPCWKPHYSLESGISELLKSFSILDNTLTTYTNL